MASFSLEKQALTSAQLTSLRRRILAVQWAFGGAMVSLTGFMAWVGNLPDPEQAQFVGAFMGCGIAAVASMLVAMFWSQLPVRAFQEAAEPPFWLIHQEHALRPKLETYLASVARQGRSFSDYERMCVVRLASGASSGGSSAGEGAGLVLVEVILVLFTALLS